MTSRCYEIECPRPPAGTDSERKAVGLFSYTMSAAFWGDSCGVTAREREDPRPPGRL